MMLADLYARVQQLAIEGTRRIAQQRILDAPLQQQRDLDPALRRGDQRAAEAHAR